MFFLCRLSVLWVCSILTVFCIVQGVCAFCVVVVHWMYGLVCILCCGCALDVWACVHSVLWLCIGCMGLCAFCVVVLLYVVCRLLLL